MKKKAVIMIAVFLFILIAPVVTHPVALLFLDNTNQENRNLVSFQDVLDAPLEKKTLAVREFIGDHLPYKNQIVALYSQLSLKLFNTTSNANVVVGQHRWLFYNHIGFADNPIADFLGTNHFTSEELQTVLLNIVDCRVRLAEQGVDFYLLVCPNKEAVYGQYLPDYLQTRRAEESRADIVVELLLQSGEGVVYPREALLAASENYQTYYKYDTHWNNLGAYVAAVELMEQMGIALPPLDELQIDEKGGALTDLANMAGIGGICQDDLDYSLPAYAEGYIVTTLDIGIYHSVNPNAPDARRVLVIGDSYFNMVAPYLYATFSEVVYVWRNQAPNGYDPAALIKQFNIDAVVLEVVERNCSMLLHEDVLV